MGTFKTPDVWKQNLAYQIGDFVLYDGTVYMAIKPVPAGTEMSSDYWIAFSEGAIVPTGEISITENGEVNVAQYATANVNVEGGGGGGGDLTTATITFSMPDLSTFIIKFPSFVDEGEDETFAVASVGSSSGEYDMILYKGAALVAIEATDGSTDLSQYSFSSTGDIQQVIGPDSYIATGNCSIMITKL